MINYQCKFIRNLSSILQPLNQLLQGNQEFKWSPRCEDAFKEAKDSLSSSNALVLFDPSLPVILQSDASQYGIGAVIFHLFANGDERLIAYASRILNSYGKNYSQIENEGLAIIFGVTKFYVYLFGRKFTQRTDHKPLLKIFAPDSATWPTAPWQRVNVDFATRQAKHYFIMVDAHCKWPEVIGPMKTTTADSTINALRNIFARYCLPTQVVSDDGPPFQSAEYEEFLRQNDIQRILLFSYHPSSNGLAERFVQTFKYAMESSADAPASSIQRRIRNLTEAPAKLFLQ